MQIFSNIDSLYRFLHVCMVLRFRFWSLVSCKSCGVALMDSPPLLVCRQSSWLPFASTLSSQSLNTSKNLSFLFNIRIQDLQMNSSNSRATLFLPEIDASSCGFYKSVCTSCNLLVVGFIFLDFTILVCLLLMQASQSSSILSILGSMTLLMGAGQLL